VIHDWDDEQATAVLKNCGRAVGPSARLLIVEGIYPGRIDPSDECRGAASNDVNMLVCTGGRQRSEDEFRSLLPPAGLTLTRLLSPPARVRVVEGVSAWGLRAVPAPPAGHGRSGSRAPSLIDRAA